MKFLTGLIFVIYLIDYSYAGYMASVEPDKVIWGYICTLIFAIVVPWGISIFVKHNNKKTNKEENNSDSL